MVDYSADVVNNLDLKMYMVKNKKQILPNSLLSRPFCL